MGFMNATMPTPGCPWPLAIEPDAAPNPRIVSANEAAATERMAEDARRVMEPFGNSKRCQILLYAEHRPGLSIGELSSLLACSVSVVSQYVAQLERQGWLRVTRAGRRRLVQVSGPQRRQAIRALRLMVAGLAAQD